jgi:hypothetical protein
MPENKLDNFMLFLALISVYAASIAVFCIGVMYLNVYVFKVF